MSNLRELIKRIDALKDRVQFYGEPISNEPLEFLRELSKDLESAESERTLCEICEDEVIN